jgi:AAA family ATP:ADP antiporter
MSKSDNIHRPEFGKVRGSLWPIYNDELAKFLPMGLMMFFILFNYTMLRDTKDALVITNAGPEVLPFLKGFIVMPAAILFVILYAKLANILSKEALFYTIVGSFIAFFGAFAFIIYPNKEFLHPDPATIEHLQQTIPNLQHIFPIWGAWSYSLFYTLSELWGSVMISLLFWQFANEITRTQEAKRFYAMFGLLANVSLIASGFTVRYMSDIRKSLPSDVDAWGVSLTYMMTAVVVAGILVMAVYRWMNTKVLTDSRYYDASTEHSAKKEKPKLSIGESFKYLMKSKYIGFIALLVLCYGLSINLVELVWKRELKMAYSDPNDYNAFMGAFSASTGIVTMILILFFKGIVRRFGWLRGAIITPAMVVITGMLFFAFVFFQDQMSSMVGMFGTTALMMAVYIGAIQNVLSKGTKYSLFDPTKEMAYIPLDQELKVKGKAAVDVIGGRLGKAGGGYFAGGLLVITAASDILMVAPILAGIVALVIGLWFFAVVRLNTLYSDAVAAEEIADNKAPRPATPQQEERKVA